MLLAFSAPTSAHTKSVYCNIMNLAKLLNFCMAFDLNDYHGKMFNTNKTTITTFITCTDLQNNISYEEKTNHQCPWWHWMKAKIRAVAATEAADADAAPKLFLTAIVAEKLLDKREFERIFDVCMCICVCVCMCVAKWAYALFGVTINQRCIKAGMAGGFTK